jgi:sec-independent protein translocase protein TatC
VDLIVKDKNFKFRKGAFVAFDNEAPVSEHIDEMRQRIFHSFGVLILITSVIFINITQIVLILETPVQGIKFIQLSPGDYFLSTVKIAFYSGLLFSIPFVISQIIFYILPGLTKSEEEIIIPILLTSVILFGLGLIFAYFILIPAALNFFIDYSTDVIEPIWSFDQYFDFILFVFYSTGLSFQVPIIQIILGLTGIITGKQMLELWRYIVLASTIISAVLTPSTDPITQICLASAILVLYLTGASILIIYKK